MNAIRFYKPSEKFKATNEMVVVGNEKDVLVTFGPHGDIGNQNDLINWIDTSAQAVIFLISFKYLGQVFYDISISVDYMKKEIKEIIKDYIDIC